MAQKNEAYGLNLRLRRRLRCLLFYGRVSVMPSGLVFYGYTLLYHLHFVVILADVAKT
jgi:hypothetical protein